MLQPNYFWDNTITQRIFSGFSPAEYQILIPLILQTPDASCTPHMVPHARTLRKAREQVKVMVADDVALKRIKAYLNQWLRWWQQTSSSWTYTEISHAYIQSCWDPKAATIAAAAFQQQQNNFIELGNCESIALAA